MPHYPQSDHIRRLFQKGQPLAFSKGDVILGNERTPNGVYFINTGYVKLYSISDQGNENLHIIYGHGEIFPMVWAYLDIEPDSLFAEAISDCELWRISRDWFNRFLVTDATLAHDMAQQMARQFQIYIDRLDNLEYRKASERVAYRLLFLASRFGVRDGRGVIIEAPITHEVFANSVNLARESVSRELEKLEKKGLIKRSEARIHIENIEALASTLTKPISLENWNFV